MSVEVIKANENIVQSLIAPEGIIMNSFDNQTNQVNIMTNYLKGLLEQRLLEISTQLRILGIDISSKIESITSSDLMSTIPSPPDLSSSVGTVTDLIIPLV
jgi:hypothetical protein